MHGGDIITENIDFPWVVLIMGQITRSYAKLCSGSVISSRWVLTAAHCMTHEEQDIPTNKLTVEVYYRLYVFREYGVQAAYRHPKFNVGKREEQDLGLLRTKYPIESASLGVIWTSSSYPNSSCTILGYGLKGGHSGKEEKDSPSLSKIRVNLLPLDMCETFYTMGNPLICLFVVDGSGPCTGDSGSPIICEDRIVGVCSRAIYGNNNTACGSFDFAMILYQRVDADWLHSTMAIEFTDSHIVHSAGFLSLTVPFICIILMNF